MLKLQELRTTSSGGRVYTLKIFLVHEARVSPVFPVTDSVTINLSWDEILKFWYMRIGVKTTHYILSSCRYAYAGSDQTVLRSR